MLTYLAVASTLLAAGALATSNYTIPADQCISPDGYNACQNPVNDQFANCVNNAGADQDMVAACATVATEFGLECVYEDCWNIVYSCEVQELVSLVAQSAESAYFPYFPAPDDAPGRCSCNLEAVELAVNTALGSYASCVNASSNLDGCACCGQAGAYAGLYTICPSVDPQVILQTLPGIDSLLSILDPQFADCGSILQQTNCESDLGFSALGGSLTYLSMLPATTGTASYSDLPGMLSTPLASVVTYSVNSIALEVTAASTDGGGSSDGSSSTLVAGGDSTSTTADSGGESSGQATATTATAGATAISSGSRIGSATTPASTTPSSAGVKVRPLVPLASIFALIAAVCFASG